jgi:hypothetical protein
VKNTILRQKIIFFQILGTPPPPGSAPAKYSVTPVIRGITMIVNNFPCPTSWLLRQVFALSFLPADHMPVTFNTLKEKATTQQLQSVMYYIHGTWFDSTVWPITAWSVFGKSVRTNNDVEGWHNRVNTHAQLEQLTVLPPDRTYIQGSIQDTATTEDDI